MRVLWFVNYASNYDGPHNAYNGGGWISSLQDELTRRRNIELAVAFPMVGEPFKTEKDGVTYYPIEFAPYSWRGRLLCKFHQKDFSYEKREWHKYIHPMLKVIEDYHPDVIEIFGSENVFSLVGSETTVPIVLHIQGLLTPYWNAFFPPSVMARSYLFESWKPQSIYKRWREIVGFRRSAWREQEGLKRVGNFIGRTDWSRRVVQVFNPQARYFYGGEILREVFYEQPTRRLPQKLSVVSTLSQPMYKGFDLVLKSAKLLKEQYGLCFEWKVFGNIDPRWAENLVNIRHADVNVKLCGVATAPQLKQEIETATVYVHTAYIENSPNSICEAQMLSVPVIATNVGGIPSLIREGETGFLVPSNDPYQVAYLVKRLFDDETLNIYIGEMARQTAIARHDKEKIVTDLLQTYRDIIN